MNKEETILRSLSAIMVTLRDLTTNENHKQALKTEINNIYGISTDKKQFSLNMSDLDKMDAFVNNSEIDTKGGK